MSAHLQLRQNRLGLHRSVWHRTQGKLVIDYGAKIAAKGPLNQPVLSVCHSEGILWGQQTHKYTQATITPSPCLLLTLQRPSVRGLQQRIKAVLTWCSNWLCALATLGLNDHLKTVLWLLETESIREKEVRSSPAHWYLRISIQSANHLKGIILPQSHAV